MHRLHTFLEQRECDMVCDGCRKVKTEVISYLQLHDKGQEQVTYDTSSGDVGGDRYKTQVMHTIATMPSPLTCF